MSAWVSVKEGLPTKRGDYLCWQPDINSDDEVSLKARGVVLHWTGQKWRSSFAVDYWMPFNPPQSNGGANTRPV